MSIFGKIWDELTRVRGREAPKTTTAAPRQPTPQSRPSAPKPSATSTSPASASTVRPPFKPTATASPPPQPVDVEKVLAEMAASKGGGGNWQTSIVDLLKLLDIDSSLAARKELADELNVQAGAHGSAEQNIALSKAVWKKIAENGGRVPASLRD